jgi:hypothetical protein
VTVVGTGTDTGPVQVQAVVEVVLGELAGAFPTTQVTGSQAQWAAALGSLQQVIDTASAVQDAVIARLAAIEPVVLEDGTIAETHRALGHAALDTPAIVSGVLNVAPAHAESRVRAALALAADGPAGTATATGLGALHTAMAAGRLDTYRAAVVAAELAEAPPQVAVTVVAALEGHFGCEDAAHLRRRCRRVLTRISPDLLVQRARRAREESGLRRWADEPGVDKWVGTFPSEDAAAAWAAIDALAHQYRTQGDCPTIERARAKALTDLVAGNATIDTTLTVTIPATALPDTVTAREDGGVDADDAGSAAPSSTGEGDLVEVTGPNGAQPVYVARSWLTTAIRDGAAVQVAPCHPATGALLDNTTQTVTAAGGTHDPAAAEATPPSDLGDNPPPVDDRDTGSGDTGASQRSAAAVGADLAGPYRPTRRMATRIKTRDRRCRFPGCTISATFCDIDHVRPWPHGPTHDTNLLCLCRRHHRIKQRLHWRLTLTADGTATWTDPTGRTRTTHPTNALLTSVLPDVITRPSDTATARRAGTDAGAGASGEPAPTTTSRARTLLPDAPHSALEFHLEHHTAPPPGHTFTPATSWRDRHGTHRTEIQPAQGITLLQPTPQPTNGDATATATATPEHWPCRRTRRPARPHDHDPPPF